MALPNTNISVAMVKAELGASSNDVGQLCIHPNINKWSKWKPVRYNSVTPITEAQLRNTNYGFDIPVTDSANFDINIVKQEWGYNKPRGGNLEPYRIDDFRNYKHNSTPIMYVYDPVSFNAINKNVIFTLTGYSQQSTITQLGMNDFMTGAYSGLGSFYFGVILERMGDLRYVITAPDTIKNGGFNIQVPANSVVFNDESIKLYFILSSDKISNVSGIEFSNILKIHPIPAAIKEFQCNVINSVNQLLPIIPSYISNSPSSGFVDISQFKKSTQQQYFNTTTGEAYVKCYLKNEYTQPIVLNESDVKMMSSYLLDGSVSNTNIQPLMYDNNGNHITSITIQPNEHLYLVFGGDALFTDDLIPMPGDKTITQIKFEWYYSGGIRTWGNSIEFGVQAIY